VLYCQHVFVVFGLFSVVAFPNAACTLSCTLSLHDALPISYTGPSVVVRLRSEISSVANDTPSQGERHANLGRATRRVRANDTPRSEEHTSELQSRENLVCRLLLEKKKNVTANAENGE